MFDTVLNARDVAHLCNDAQSKMEFTFVSAAIDKIFAEFIGTSSGRPHEI